MWGLLNVLSIEDRKAVIYHQSGFEDAAYPAHAPRDLARAVAFPTLYFGDDFISRDPKKPTFFVFDPSPAPGTPARGFLLGGEVKLACVHQRLVDLKLHRVTRRQRRSAARRATTFRR